MPNDDEGLSRRRKTTHEREQTARPDRVGLKVMSVHVVPLTWRFFKKQAIDLEVTQEKVLARALALYMSRYRGVPEDEHQAVWEAIEKEIKGRS
jgi:hypothetical protein